MAQSTESGRVPDGSGGHRIGLVERICRSIITRYDANDSAHVFSGDRPRFPGPGDTSANILERRAIIRSVIACTMLLAALLLWGLLLVGLDQVDRHRHDAEHHNGEAAPQPATTDSGCYYAASISFVDSPIIYQGR